MELDALVVDAGDPMELATFWQRVLGGRLRNDSESVVLTASGIPPMRFRPQELPKTVKNRVHPDVWVNDISSLLDLGATVLAEYLPERTTLADPEGNEFCAFLAPRSDPTPPAALFAVCVDSDRPEELAAWWAAQVGARIGPGTDGTPRWLYDSAGWQEVIWKFVRVADVRVTPNRWRWAVRGPGSALRDPQGNEFERV